ncbi:MAG: hypothetical protein HYW23_00520 [Candidatus Aenigmarchaeota archaeon]|nr:hypothetical protein [Candidatus Aenigmarchaeota archaeon]
MIDPARELLRMMKNDFIVYGYTPASHVIKSLENVGGGKISFEDFRRTMSSGISCSLRKGYLNGEHADHMRTTLGRLKKGLDASYYDPIDASGRYVTIPSLAQFKEVQ